MRAKFDGSPIDWSSIRSLLLLRLRSIGDTVLMTPCLSALKSWRPDVRLAVGCEPLSAPVLEGHPFLDELIVVPRASRARFLMQLRRRSYDLAVNMHGGTTATLLAAFSGAKLTAGYRGYGLSWLLDLRAPDPDVILGRSEIHSVEQQLALLHWLGVPWPGPRPKLVLAVDELAREKIKAELARRGILGDFAVIAPAAAFDAKRWPSDRFAAVIDYLRQNWGLPAAIMAGPGQEDIADRTATMARTRPSVFVGMSLKEAIALISLSSLFIGNDSGPMHIAAALGRPIVAIFGPSDATIWRPWTDSPHRVVKPAGDRRAIELIPTGQVIEALEGILSERAC